MVLDCWRGLLLLLVLVVIVVVGFLVLSLVSPCKTMLGRKKSKTSKAPSGSRINVVRPPNVDTMGIDFDDQASWDYFMGLKDRKIRPTRFYDVVEVEKLGINLEVEYLLQSLGWEHFMKIQDDTYRRLTLEFLSSTHLNVVDDEP